MTRARVFLWGPMGAGKTSVGRALASARGAAFADLDQLVETAVGSSITDLVAARGEARLREVERACLLEVLDAPATGEVIALGGGSLLGLELRERVLRAGVVVGLQAPVDELSARLGSGHGRPLLAGAEGTRARLAGLLRERAAAYEVAHVHVATVGCSPTEIAAALAQQLDEGVFPVTVSATVAYAAALAPGRAAVACADALDVASPTRVALVTDANVAALHLPAFREALAAGGWSIDDTVVVPAGEDHKVLQTVERIATELAEIDRGGVVLSLGGGVVSDLTGFVCSMLSRGVRWIAVPTTVLAMADAALGGKTGVNLGSIKNRLGAFHHPLRVVIDPTFALTQSPRDVRSGLAEVVKSAAVRDESAFAWLEKNADRLIAGAPELAVAVGHAARIKAAVVSEDPGERGSRAILNFGHTLGHALEGATSFTSFTHGEAVAVGMAVAARASQLLELCGPDVPTRVRDLLVRLGLPVDTAPDVFASAKSLLAADKKRRGRLLELVMLSDIGRCERRSLPIEEAESLLSLAAGAG